MADIDDSGYTEHRSFQQLANMGQGEASAAQTPFETTQIEENESKFSRIGRNPRQGVAVTVENFDTTITLGMMTPEEAAEKADTTGLSNVRVEDGYYMGDDKEGKPFIMGHETVELDEEPSEGKPGGVTLGDVETFINAPFSGLSRGLLKASANTLGAIGVLDQEKVDEFFRAVDEINAIATEGNIPAQVGGFVGEIGGQFVLPIATAHKALTAMGASTVLASILAESATGALAISPSEENLAGMIPEDSEAFGAMRELLATDPEDSEWENRARNAAEALVLFGTAEAAVRGFIKAIGKAQNLAKSPVVQEVETAVQDITPDQVQGVLDEVNVLPAREELDILQDLDELTPEQSARMEELEFQVVDEAEVDQFNIDRPIPRSALSDAPFFSSVEVATKGLKQEKGTGDQMLNMIAKSAGVKKEEMAWIGLNDTFRGKKSVTKQQILDYVDQNKVEIKEVTLQDTGVKRDLTQEEYDGVLREIEGEIPEEFDQLSEKYTISVDDGELLYKEGELDRGRRGFELQDHDDRFSADVLSQGFTDAANILVSGGTLNRPKFGNYVLPGGDNYREVLMTLPSRKGAVIKRYEIRNSDTGVVEMTAGDLEDSFQDGLIDSPDITRKEVAESFADAIMEDESGLIPNLEVVAIDSSSTTGDFVGGHFDEPNVLAHLRLNDRVGPNGEKILFIEEIQSDWMQAGRKQGFKTGGEVTKIELEHLHAKAGDALNTVDLLGFSSRGEAMLAVRSEPNYVTAWDLADEPGVVRAVDEWLDARRGFRREEAGVPDAPLKKTWHEMAFRRATQMAAEEGYDMIAWTPGKMQADRYNLRNVLDEISYRKLPSGKYKLSATNKEGVTVLADTNFSEEEISDMVGKDMAQKIVDGKGTAKGSDGDFVLSGEDLEIGGEGMITFYDSMVKNYAKKFGKKFDAQVGTTKISGESIVSGETIGNAEGIPELQIEQWWGELEPSERTSLVMKHQAKFTEVWSLPITDKMKKTLTEDGIPLFSIGAAPLAVQQEEQEDIQVASIASKFLRGMLGQAAKPKAARVAEELINYGAFKDTIPEGVNFNMQNLHTTEDVKNQMDIVAKEYQGVENTPVPQSLTNDIAQLLGDTPGAAEQAVKGLPGDVKDLHIRALTMRNLLVSSAEETDRLARIVADGGADVSDGDYLRFRQQIVRYAELQKSMKGVQSEIGRALASFRIPAGATERNPQITSELIDRIGGRGTTVELANRWITTPLDRRSDFAGRSMWARTRSAVFEAWINGLLSGFRTHQINTVGNTAFTMMQIPERAIAATIGVVARSPDRVRFQEVMAMFHGMGNGSVNGLKLARKTWKTEMPSDGIAKIEAQTLKAITPENFNVNPDSIGGKAIDYIGQGLRLPGRALMTEDEFFKAVGYRMELEALSTRQLYQARDEGAVSDMIIGMSDYALDTDMVALTRLRETADSRKLDVDELSELYDIMINNPSPQMSSDAHDFATMITFQTELGEMGKSFQTFVGRFPGARVIAPFIRTPINIVKEFARRTPAALAMPSVGRMLKAGGAERDLALARIGVGTSLMAWASGLAMEGTITGGGPSRADRTYAQWRATHEPYSMRIGGTWVPYGRLEPVAMLFGSVADASDFFAYSDNEATNQEVYMAALVGVMKNIGDKTTMQGITNFSDAYSDPARYAEGYLANLARTMIPFSSMMRDVTRAIDPVMRQTRPDPMEGAPINEFLSRVLNEVKAGLPGFSKDLPPKRTFWGEERYAYEGSGFNSFFAFRTKSIKKSPIDSEMVRLNTPLAMPSPRVGNFELNAVQYDRLVVLMNKEPSGMPDLKLVLEYGNTSMRTAMNNLVQSELWKQVESDTVKIDYLRTIRNDYVDAAKRALALEDTDVNNAAINEKADKMLLQGQQSIIQQLGPISTQITPPTGVQ